MQFIMGWTRTNDPTLHAQVLMTFNPPTTSEGRWVIKFFAPGWTRTTRTRPRRANCAGSPRWVITTTMKYLTAARSY